MAHIAHGKLIKSRCKWVCVQVHMLSVFLCDSVQLSAFSCVHLVFLMEEIAHKQTRSSCYVQIVP